MGSSFSEVGGGIIAKTSSPKKRRASLVSRASRIAEPPSATPTSTISPETFLRFTSASAASIRTNFRTGRYVRRSSQHGTSTCREEVCPLGYISGVAVELKQNYRRD